MSRHPHVFLENRQGKEGEIELADLMQVRGRLMVISENWKRLFSWGEHEHLPPLWSDVAFGHF